MGKFNIPGSKTSFYVLFVLGAILLLVLGYGVRNFVVPGPAARLNAQDAALFANAKPDVAVLGAGAGRYGGPSQAVIYNPSGGQVSRENLAAADDMLPTVDHGVGPPGNAPKITSPIRPADPRIARVVWTAQDGGHFCSGTLVGHHHVLTAGHCVHDGRGGDFHRNIQVTLGYDNGNVIYGPYQAGRLITFAGWADASDNQHDVALIELRRGLPEGVYNWFGMRAIEPGCEPLQSRDNAYIRRYYSIDWEQGGAQAMNYGMAVGCHLGMVMTQTTTGHGSSGSAEIDTSGQFIFAVHSAEGGNFGFDALLTRAKVCFMFNQIMNGPMFCSPPRAN